MSIPTEEAGVWDALWFLVTVGVTVRLVAMSGTIRELRARIESLERRRAFAEEPPAVPLAPPSDAIEVATPPPSAPAVAPAYPSPPAASPPTSPPATPPRPRNFELQFGGLWLQNIGAVLLLLGIFFMIVWGYTTGRFGPEVIVDAGIVGGLILAWRGDRTARRLPGLGHALIGIGIGVVYLSIYLGHFTLHVLSAWVAFAALAVVSAGSIATGIRYQTQAISALGVVGAFVPPLAAAWLPLRGFPMTPAGLVAYLATVDLVVFGLAARPGWSALNLAALGLSAVTWIATFTQPSWGWGVQIALAVLFAFLGLAPLPRLSRAQGPVPPRDLAIIALAPLCLVACSWPTLAFRDRSLVAILLFALAGLYLGAALWVDSRRSARDLWQPLTAASTLFLTAALQRWVGTENTPMAWSIEGALLVALGTGARGGWLRACGYVVAAVAALWSVVAMALATWNPHDLPVFYPDGIRDLVGTLAVLALSFVLNQRREAFAPAERVIAHLWIGMGQILLMIWLGREAYHLAFALEGSGGRWQRIPAVVAPTGATRLDALVPAIMSAAWLAQGATLLALSRRQGIGFVRICGYAITAIASLLALTLLVGTDGWSSDQAPILHPAGLLSLGCIAGLAVLALRLRSRRALLGGEERRMPQFWTAVAGVLMLAWSAREAGHVARTIEGLPGVMGRSVVPPDPEALARSAVLTYAITSGAWLIQAVVLLAVGWARNSVFLRWSGLALFGITVLKFLVVDLQSVDVFWRFLTAIVVGLTLLGVSYAYQRRSRVAAEGGASEPNP